MPSCNFCGREVPEVFECDKCRSHFCSYHLDASMHDCASIIGAPLSPTAQPVSYISPQQAMQSSITPSTTGTSMHDRGRTDGSFTWYHQESYIPENAFDPDSGIDFSGIMWQKKSELVHFLVGGSLIYIIGFISFFNWDLVSSGLLWAIFLLAFFYTTAFLFHELGHRQVAKHYKLQTKFRLLTFGMILTAFSLAMGVFSLVGGLNFPSLALPGAVVVLGLDEISHRTGMCKVAGPFINLIYGIGLFITAFVIPKELYPLNMLIAMASTFNFSLGAFNMIPIGILDGQNILKWKKEVWIFLMIGLVVMIIVNYAVIYTPELHLQYFAPSGYTAG